MFKTGDALKRVRVRLRMKVRVRARVIMRIHAGLLGLWFGLLGLWLEFGLWFGLRIRRKAAPLQRNHYW